MVCFMHRSVRGAMSAPSRRAPMGKHVYAWLLGLPTGLLLLIYVLAHM